MSIKQHALLVSLSVSKPQLTQKDEKATYDAEVANAAANAGQYRKDLYPKHLIAPIVAVESSARAYMAGTTYPWARSADLLPTARFMDFADRMGKYELEFSQCVTAFLNNWNNVMREAQARQGNMFDASVYPDLTDLRAQFVFRVAYRPVTDVGDFRVAMQEDELSLLRETVERDMQASMAGMMQEPLKRLRGVVEKLASATGNDRTKVDKKTGATVIAAPIFRDTLIDNITHEIRLLKDFADLLPDDIKQLAIVASDTCTPHPDGLRVDPELRRKTNINAKSLLAAIEELM